MRHASTSIAAGAFLVTALLGQSQTIELRSGEVLIGRVSDITDREVTIEINFPDPTTRTIPRADLDPLSLYTILAARTAVTDAKAHAKLAQLARDLGLPAQAIAEYREAARLDPSLKTAMDASIKDVQNALAADLLEDAREAMNEGRLAAARLLLHAIASKYANTPAAKDAAILMAEVAAKEQSAYPGTKVISPKDLEAAMKRASDHMNGAEKVGGAPSPHGGVRGQRHLENKIVHLESAWKAVKDLAGASGDAGLTDRFLKQRDEIRQALVSAHLAIGTIFVERRALPSADAHCEKACEMDPENKDNHALHALILQAKISRGYTKARSK